MREESTDATFSTPNFSTWPLDLLIDYLKKYHGRKDSQLIPETRHLLEVVTRVHGESHPELMDVLANFLAIDKAYLSQEKRNFYGELSKLATQLTELLLAQDSVDEARYQELKKQLQEEIIQAKNIHQAVGQRFSSIADLTENYQPPVDACQSYRRVLDFLEVLDKGFQEQLYLINDLLSPQLQG